MNVLPPSSRKINLVQENVDVKGRKMCRLYSKVVRVVENQDVRYGNRKQTLCTTTLKKEVACYSICHVSIYYPVRCKNPKDRHLKNSSSKNLKNA